MKSLVTNKETYQINIPWTQAMRIYIALLKNGTPTGTEEAEKVLMALAEKLEENLNLLTVSPGLLATLKCISEKIDEASGSPHFTAEEHDMIEKLIKSAERK